ncbi:hypothetical protein DFH05DRAFT_1487820 [Lentinula detonsa]|uniref:Uncharacterized protein n=1 Tax=Lentinula detonsa TaxID=2804962 RepID=A0A9W8P231_9AGAR|nr:hypothetical protein DFH05DRAFT_1487820 [Lentinula detonsa]
MEQEKRVKQLQGVLPASSDSDELSLLEQEDQVGSDLSLQRAPTGKFYYMYGSGASQYIPLLRIKPIFTPRRCFLAFPAPQTHL